MGLFDAIGDLFFGGAEKDAAKETSRAAIEAGQLQLQGSREGLDFLQRSLDQSRLDTRPLRYGGGAAYNAYLSALGLPQQDFADRTLPTVSYASGAAPSGVGVTGGAGAPSASGGPVNTAVGGGLGGYLGEQAADFAFRSGAGNGLAKTIGQTATGKLLDFAGPIGAAVGGFIGTNKGRSTEAKLGSAALSAGGYALGGPIGGAIGGYLGGLLAGKHDPRYGVSIGPGGQLVDDKGNDLGIIQLPQQGFAPVPNVSRDGHPIYVDPQGNFFSGVKNGGQMMNGIEVLPLGGGFNLSQAGQAFTGLPGVTNTSGGTKFPKYTGSLSGAPVGSSQPLAGVTGGPAGTQQGRNPNGALIDGRTGMVIDTAASPQVRGTAPVGQYGGFQQSPGYQFAVDQMSQGVNRAASASGDLGSGRHLKDMARFSQNLANLDFGNYLGQLQTAFAPGTAAVSNQSQNTLNTGVNSANTLANGVQGYASGIAQGGLLRGEGGLLANNARRSSIFDIAGSLL